MSEVKCPKVGAAKHQQLLY